MCGDFMFFLIDLDLYWWLVVVGGGESFWLFGGDCGVVFDEFGYYFVFGFDI